jgi:hypothetical protein
MLVVEISSTGADIWIFDIDERFESEREAVLADSE